MVMNVLNVVENAGMAIPVARMFGCKTLSFLLLPSVYLGSDVIALTIAIVIVFAIACVNKPQEALLWR